MAKKREETLAHWQRQDMHAQNETWPRVTICLVLYNSTEFLKEWAAAIKALDYPKEKLFFSIVENGSKDDSAAHLRRALKDAGLYANMESLIQQDNQGFGAAQNKAVKASSSDYVLIINPDAYLEKNSLKHAVQFAQRDENDICAWEFSQSPVEHPKYYDPVTLETSWNSHAAILMKRKMFEAVKGYDKNIFMYGEDVDLSYKFRANGMRLRYLPQAKIQHDISSQHGLRTKEPAYNLVANLLLRRRYGTYRDRLVGLIILLSTLLRPQTHSKLMSQTWSLFLKNRHGFKPNRPQNIKFPFNGVFYDRRRMGQSRRYTATTLHDKKVSIITRLHKNTTIVNQAVHTVLNQTYKNIEHIIVCDDCDPPNYHNDELKIVAIKERNRSRAANIGASHATGDFLLFLDYDDILYANHINSLILAFNDNPDAICTYSYSWESGTKNRSKNTDDFLHIPLQMESQFHQHNIMKHNSFAIQSVMIRKTAFDDTGGFNETIHYQEDWDLWKRLIQNGGFASSNTLTSIFFTPSHLKERIHRTNQHEIA